VTILAALDRGLDHASHALALAGGAALCAAALLTTASVAGRAAGAPVPGDYELVQIACAFAVFSFLPWCQRRRAHAAVDILADRLAPRATRRAGDALTAALAALVAWRLGAGLADRMGDGFFVETTFILRIPVWWGYAAALPGAALFAVAAGFDALTGRA
jgi:TRAP-type C4-dicarboxylate transport system permease small subunit